MKIVILKFGGTSVTDNIRKKNICKIIKKTIKNNETPVVVVSAIGRYPDNYATDTLISLVNDKYKNNNLKEMDLLMSVGEIISAAVISAFLQSKNINALPITGFQAGIITDNNYSNASVIKYDDSLIKKLLDKNIVPVVAGFQGINEEGFITTLGRGGSDTTATILGNMLNAIRIEIYTDVNGIYDSDPNINEKAKIYKKLSYQKALEYSRVIHNKSIKYASSKSIPIIIKNINNNSKGTIIK